jgi:hypothetical protein
MILPHVNSSIRNVAVEIVDEMTVYNGIHLRRTCMVKQLVTGVQSMTSPALVE